MAEPDEDQTPLSPRFNMDDYDNPPAADLESSAQSPEQPNPDLRLVFQMNVTQLPIDFLLSRHGLTPTEELRFTVAQTLNLQSSGWLDLVVKELAEKVARQN